MAKTQEAIGPNQFRCDVCNRILDKAWSDEEAAAELAEVFPGFDKSECGIVCASCYKAMGFDLGAAAKQQ